mmetsp:Transcript_35320/g.112927  ORF Transcript_35320/g.112927 Transcript_35320/m.112927 type:complete len:156 (-) Transcript_35320:108-575(-)
MYVNLNSTEVKYQGPPGRVDRRRTVWTAGSVVPTQDRRNLPRDVRAVAALCANNVDENGKLAWGAVERTLGAIDGPETTLEDGTTVPLPSNFLASFDTRALASAFDALNALNADYVPDGGDGCPGSSNSTSTHPYTASSWPRRSARPGGTELMRT